MVGEGSLIGRCSWVGEGRAEIVTGWEVLYGGNKGLQMMEGKVKHGSK